jgi:hypothetical protein
MNSSDLKVRIEEAVMLDDPKILHRLRLSRKQILDFVYIVKGAKSVASSQTSPRPS